MLLVFSHLSFWFSLKHLVHLKTPTNLLNLRIEVFYSSSLNIYVIVVEADFFLFSNSFFVCCILNATSLCCTILLFYHRACETQFASNMRVFFVFSFFDLSLIHTVLVSFRPTIIFSAASLLSATYVKGISTGFLLLLLLLILLLLLLLLSLLLL